MNRKHNRKLVKGDRIVIGFKDHLRHRNWAKEYEVIRTNGSSAYAIAIADTRNPQRREVRIKQGTLEVVESVMSFVSRHVYDDMQSYQDYIDGQELLLKTREKVAQIIPSLDQNELETILIKHGHTISV